MSMVSHLNEEYMKTQCPCCGLTVEVFESNLCGTFPDGKGNTATEYSARCPRCNQSFYVSTAY